MASSVDLPQPDGPTSTTNSPFSTLEVDALQHLDGAEALAQLADAERRHVVPYLIAPWRQAADEILAAEEVDEQRRQRARSAPPRSCTS